MLSRLSVRKPYTVLACVIIVIVLGVVCLTNMTADLLPNMSFPYAIIVTTDPGASPEEVERNVTAPIESAIATTSNVENVSSVSYNSYSMVMAEYAQDANMDSVVIEIQQQLDQVTAAFDDRVGAPIIMRIDPDMLPIMIAAVDYEGYDSLALSDYVADDVMPNLESIEGVASATANGRIEETIRITLNEEKIKALNDAIHGDLEAQFAEAQAEIDQGRQELEDGKAAAEEGQNALADGIASASTEISNQKITLYQTEADLALQKSLLTLAAQVLQAGSERMNGLYQEASAIASSMQTIQTALQAAGETLPEEVLEAQLGMTREEALAALAEYETQLSALNEVIGTEWQQLADRILNENGGSALSNGPAAQNLQLASQEFQNLITRLQNLGGGDPVTYEDLPEAISGLAEYLTQVNMGIAAIDAAGAQIAAGKTALDDAMSALNRNSILSSIELSGALSAITSGEAALQQAQAQLDAAKTQAFDQADLTSILSVETVQGLLTAQNFEMPAGYITEEDGQYLVRVGLSVKTEEDLKNLPLIDMHMDSVGLVTLADVADVVRTDNTAETYARINGQPGILLSFEKQTGYSTGDVTDDLLARFERLSEEVPGLHFSVLMDQGVYIDLIVREVVKNMIMGALLAVLVLVVFLRDFRPTVIIACAIPLSVIGAIILMYFSGVTLNVISMGGLALGIGMLVDNAIVVIENIYRMRAEGVPLKKAAVEGAREVSGAIISSTLTTVCVFAPIIFVKGITKQLFVDIGLTVAYTLAASLVVALTLVPAMAGGMLRKQKEVKEGGLFNRLMNGYQKFLRGALKWRVPVLILTLVLTVLSAMLAMTRGTAFLPEMSSTQLSVSLNAKEDDPLEFEELAACADTASERLQAIQDVQTVGAMMGSGSSLSLLGGGGGATLYVLLDENTKRTTREVSKEIETVLADLPCEVNVTGASMDMTALTGSGLSVQVRGRDLKTMQRCAQEVAAILESVEGTAKVDNGMGDVTNEFTITVDKEKAAGYGMTVAQIFQLVATKMMDSQKTTTLVTDIKDYQVYVNSGEQVTATRAMLEGITFPYTDRLSGETEEVKLTQVASFTNEEGLSAIRRESQNRYLNVSAQIADGYNVGLVGAEVEQKLAAYEVPAGCEVKMEGENTAINDAMRQVVYMMLLAIVLIYLIMVAQFQSLLHPFIIMFTIPLAFTGGFLALWMSGSEVSVVALVGFVMLAGIIVNNGIVLVDYMNQLRREGMDKREAIVTAARTRVRPVLMTALTTIVSMSVMALSHQMGSEIMRPMAIVEMGGLVYGTLLTLVVVPCIYDLFSTNKSMLQEEV